MQRQLGIGPGGGFCSQMLGDSAGAVLNNREVTKLDIECAKLADARLYHRVMGIGVHWSLAPSIYMWFLPFFRSGPV